MYYKHFDIKELVHHTKHNRMEGLQLNMIRPIYIYIASTCLENQIRVTLECRDLTSMYLGYKINMSYGMNLRIT
jgi:hypothetical protein